MSERVDPAMEELIAKLQSGRVQVVLKIYNDGKEVGYISLQTFHDH